MTCPLSIPATHDLPPFLVRFLIVAPDSHNTDQWFTPNAGQPFTSDWEHIEACFQHVRGLRGVRINSRWIFLPAASVFPSKAHTQICG